MAQEKARNLKFDLMDETPSTQHSSVSIDISSDSEFDIAPFDANLSRIENAIGASSFQIPPNALLAWQLLCVALGLFYLDYVPALILVGTSSIFTIFFTTLTQPFIVRLQSIGAVALAFVASIFIQQLVFEQANWNQFLFVSFCSLLVASQVASKLAREWLLDDCLLVTYQSDDKAVLLDPNLAFAEREILISSVKVGDIVRFHPDENVYADGLVLSGVAEVEQRLASGQSRFCIKGKGDPIFAGSSIVSGTIDVKVELAPHESNFTRSVDLIKNEISKLEIQVNRLQNSPTILAGLSPHVALSFIAIVSSVVWAVVFNNWSLGLWSAASIMSLSVLVEFVMKLKPILLRHLLISSFSKGVLVNDFLKVYKASLSSDKIACLGINAIDNTAIGKDFEISVSSFEVIDDRVDSHTLKSVLVSILGRSEASVHLSIAEYIRADLDNLRLYEMTSASAEPDIAGVADAVEAVVEGVTFRMGSEEWLISKGVMIQPNELIGLGTQTAPYIIAMGNEVVAIAKLSVPLDADVSKIKKLTDLVKFHGIKTVLIEDQSRQDLTATSKAAGIQLEDILPVNSDESIINKLSHISPVTLIAPSGTSSLIEAAASVIARPYHFYENINLRPMSFGFLSSVPSSVGWFLLAIRKCQKLIDFQQTSTRLVVILLTAVSIFGFASPLVVLTSATILGVFLFFRR